MTRYRNPFKQLAVLSLVLLVAAAGWSVAQQTRALRLYVFDCGTLHYDNADTYRLKREEVARTDMSMACFLVTHPNGTLMWDTGGVSDSDWQATGSPVRMKLLLPDNTSRDVSLRKTLRSQLAASGYDPAEITHLALSHYHWDHIANANQFLGATWLVPKAEFDVMLSATPPERSVPANYGGLAKAKTVTITKDEYDVFGDGKVLLKAATGHTQGHQVLFVNLPRTGPVVLAGDLYHYPEERKLNRLPTREFNADQTAAARAALEEFLRKTGAQLWIQHDIAAHEKLKKAPAFYD